MPRRRSSTRIGSYERSLRDFTLATAIIWILITILFLVLSIIPSFHAVGLVADLVIMFSAGSLFICTKTRQQYYLIPFMTVLVLFVAYILANIILIQLLLNGLQMVHNTEVILNYTTNIEFLINYPTSTTAIGIVLIIIFAYYIFRGLLLYYLKLKKYDVEPELERKRSTLSVHFE